MIKLISMVYKYSMLRLCNSSVQKCFASIIFISILNSSRYLSSIFILHFKRYTELYGIWQLMCYFILYVVIYLFTHQQASHQFWTEKHLHASPSFCEFQADSLSVYYKLYKDAILCQLTMSRFDCFNKKAKTNTIMNKLYCEN